MRKGLTLARPLCKLTSMHRTSHPLALTLGIFTMQLAALSLPVNASVLRCKTADGRISYQDSSCPNGARGEAVDATPNRGFRFATEQDIKKAMRPPPEERPPRVRSSKTKVRQVLNAGERRFILTGMSGAEVRRRIGPPDHIGYASSSAAKRRSKDSGQQWIYLPAVDDPQTTTTLTVKGGMVLHVDRKVTR
jgi:hypothetical protein